MLGLALCATPGLAGHASSGPLVPIAMPADTLHVAGVGIWLGGLVMLFAAFMPRSDERSLREVVPRYSQYALVAMGVIVVTGVFQAFRQIDRLGALRRHGLRAAAAHQGRCVPGPDGGRCGQPRRREPALAHPGGPARRARARRRDAGRAEDGCDPRLPRTSIRWRSRRLEHERRATTKRTKGFPEGYVLDEPTAERRLRRSLLLEVVISVVILAVTALLVNAAPARELDTGPYLATLNTKQISFDVTITPANRGANEMHLFTLTPSGGTTDPTEVTAEMSQ